MEKKESMKNPFNICIWKEKSICEECPIKNEFQCHLDLKYSVMFGATFFMFFIPSVIGIFNLGIGSILFYLTLSIWVVYLIFFFLIWEPRILCSHCPYYAEGNTKILHCYANGGFIKTTHFKPQPMSQSEQIQFIIGVILIPAIPFTFLVIGQQYLSIGIAFIGIIIWFFVLIKKICTVCINFSCPLNRVPKEIVDKFLEYNPIMKEAWNKSMYQ